MIRTSDILMMLRPEGDWVCRGEGLENVEFIKCEPITKAEFDKAQVDYSNWLSAQEKQKAEIRQSVLDKIGLTEEEIKVLLG